MDAVHLDGWRHELAAEAVECLVAAPGGAPKLLVQTTASGFPLKELLTRDRLVEECRIGNDVARARAGLAEASASTCVREEPTLAAVVVLAGSCGKLGELGDDDLARLNEMRAVEVALLAVPADGDCPTAEEATAWAEREVRSRGEDLHVTSSDEGEACYRPVTYWDRGEVLVQPLGFQSG